MKNVNEYSVLIGRSVSQGFIELKGEKCERIFSADWSSIIPALANVVLELLIFYIWEYGHDYSADLCKRNIVILKFTFVLV